MVMSINTSRERIVDREKTDAKGRITDGTNDSVGMEKAWKNSVLKDKKRTLIYSEAEYTMSKINTCQIKLALRSRQTVGQLADHF